MSHTRLLTAGLFSLLLLLPAARAQIVTTRPAPAQRAEPRKVDKELERKASALLDEVLDEGQGLKLPENRIRLQMTAAELLWPRDKARARDIFRAAMNNLAAAMSAITPDDPQYYNLINAPAQLRQQMLQMVAPRDPKLALDFLRATRQPPPEQPGTNYRQPDPELALELSLAEQIAAADPQQALQLAEETLSKGLSYNLGNVVEQLRRKNPEAADRLATEIVQRLRTADFASDYMAANVASYLLQTTRAEAAQGDGKNIASLPNPRQLHVADETRRDLINTMVRAVLNPTVVQRQSGNLYSLVSALQQALPEVERYAPAQAATLRRRLTEYEQAVNPQAALWRQYQPLLNTGPLDALLEAAASAPPEMRGQLYQAAAWRAFNEGGVERARDIINTHVENRQQRTQMLRELEQRVLWDAAQRGDVEQAARLLERITNVGERVNVTLNLARVAAEKGQTQTAQQLVDDAANLLSGRAQTADQFSGQLQIAQAYVPLAPARAFELVEARVGQLNELLAAAATVDGFGQQQFEQDELRLQDGYMWGGLIEQCGFTLALLAAVDFDRARADADKFQRLEARLPVRLAIARSVLAEQASPNGRSPRISFGGGIGSGID